MAQDSREGPDAYALILEAIDQGVLGPGARLREVDLAARFGVSRTPIREALKQLETQGVVTHEPRRGAVVAELDYDALHELYAVREVMEGLAARLAARHAASEEITLLQDMVRSDQALINDPGALAQANRRFHRQIHRASHNRYLHQMLQAMRRSLVLLSGSTLALQGRGQASLEEHAEIVEAISRREEDAADAAARRHISNAFQTRLRIEGES